MVYLLQFCGLSDPLQLFYLEQRSLAVPPRAAAGSTAADTAANPAGPAYGGFRPFQLDHVLEWALETARGRCWDGEAIQRTVLDGWLERADLIRHWQLRLRQEPADRLLVAGIGTRSDWDQQCEALLRA